MTLRKIDENMIDDKLTNKVNGVVAKADELSTALAEKAKQSDVSSLATTKADKTYVDNNLDTVNSRVTGIDRGYGGTYATVTALQIAYPTGNTNRYVVSADGKWYFWNGTAWTSGGVFQSTGIGYKTITEENTTFIQVSPNLFNKYSVLVDKSVDVSGNVINEVGRVLSDFIPVAALEVLHFTPVSFRIAYYNVSKNPILRTGTDGVQSSKSVAVDPTIAYMRVSPVSADVSTLMINRGISLLPYEAYSRKLIGVDVDASNLVVKGEITFADLTPTAVQKLKELDDKIVTPKKTTFFELGNNLFNKNTMQLNKSVDFSGNVIDEVGRSLSEFIEVTPNVTDSHTLVNVRIMVYDANKTFIVRTGNASASLGGVDGKITPSNPAVKYIRFSPLTSDVAKFMFNRGSTLLPYEEFNLVLKSSTANPFIIDPSLLPNSATIDTGTLKEEIAADVLSASALNPYPPQLSPVSIYTGYNYPLWLSEDGSTLWGNNGTQLLQSKDEWATRQNVGTPLPHTIIGVRDLKNGKLLVSTNRTDDVANSKLYLYDNYDVNNPSVATYREVFTALSPRANIQNQWGMSVYNNIIAISEYGLRGDVGGRYAYLSTDYGEKFKTIFDLVNQVVEGRPKWTVDAHIHTIAYDPYFSRIWLCVGDSVNTATYFSDDMGTNWTFVVGSNVIQYTGIVCMEDCVIFGSDRAPNGIYIYRRKDRSTMPVIKPHFLINDKKYITHVFTLPFRRNGLKGTPVYFNATSAGSIETPQSTVIVGFADGKKGHLLLETEPIYSPGANQGIGFVFGATAQGNLIYTITDTSISGQRVMMAPAPLWR